MNIYDAGWKKYTVDSNNPIHFVKRFLVKGFIRKIAKKNMIIGDIGCGVGVLCQELSKFGKVTGYDANLDLINLAKSVNKKKNVSFEKRDLFKIQGKEKFDIIVMTEVLEYIKDDVKALKKANWLIKNKGYLILTVPVNSKFKTEIDAREDFIRYTKDNLCNKLKKSSFRIIKSKYWGFPLINWFYLNIYVPSSNKKANKKKVSKGILLSMLLLKAIRYLFLLDLIFNSKNSFDLFIVAKKA